MSTLDVPGAKLDYQIVGEGPLLLLIAGARGSGAIYRQLAQHLASRFRVLTYDRRGYGGSTLEGEQDYSVRLQTDADDVARLIAREDGKAVVFGSSSGAIVALDVLTRHNEAVRLLLAHEPPAMSLLPDPEQHFASLQELYELYRAQGLLPAMGKFLTTMMTASDRETLSEASKHGDPEQAARDIDYWFEHEVRQYPMRAFDMAALKAGAPLEFIVGRESEGLPPEQIATLFAERLGVPLQTLPGGHVGYLTYAAEFGQRLIQVIEASGIGEAA